MCMWFGRGKDEYFTPAARTGGRSQIESFNGLEVLPAPIDRGAAGVRFPVSKTAA